MTPHNLLVPPALETTAEKWLASIAPATAADVNPFSGSLSLVVEPRLSSATRWYVTADPGEIDGLEFAYLSGAEGPQVESRSGWDVELRDYNWLNNPQYGLGDGFQGYDFRFAVNCNNGTYNEEEGNYGKLLRIWPAGASYAPGLTPLLSASSILCRAFEEDVIWSGFEVLATDILARFGGGNIVPLLNEAGQTAGFRSTKIGMILKRLAPKAKEQVDICKLAGVKRAVVLTDKYQWSDNELVGDRLVRRGEGRKPKHFISHLSES